MNNKKKEVKKQEVERVQPPGLVSPFGRFDLFSDPGFFKELDQFFEEYLPRRWRQAHLGWPGRFAGHPFQPFEGKSPCIDIQDRENDFLVKAEMPGVDKKDISITISGNTLTLEASLEKEKKEEKTEYFRREICRGSYRRTIDLPVAVKENEAKATFQNGILELTIPKMEKTKRSTIKVE